MFGQSRRVQARARLAEAAEDHLLEPSNRKAVADGAHGDAGGAVGRKAVDAGRDGRKGDAAQPLSRGDLQRTAVATRQERLFAFAAATPYRANRVDDEAGRQPITLGDLGV